MPEIRFVKTVGALDEFALLADGQSDGSDRRPVLALYVDRTDEALWIAPYDTKTGQPQTWSIQKTSGVMHRHPLGEIAETDPETALMVDALGIVDGQTDVCMGTMYHYVTERAFTLMARVYYPKAK